VEESQDDRIDMSAFNFGFNPDVGTGQIPVTEEDKTQADADEKDVREACTFLVEKCIPALVR
jgi:protein TIF31